MAFVAAGQESSQMHMQIRSKVSTFGNRRSSVPEWPARSSFWTEPCPSRRNARAAGAGEAGV